MEPYLSNCTQKRNFLMRVITYRVAGKSSDASRLKECKVSIEDALSNGNSQLSETVCAQSADRLTTMYQYRRNPH